MAEERCRIQVCAKEGVIRTVFMTFKKKDEAQTTASRHLRFELTAIASDLCPVLFASWYPVRRELVCVALLRDGQHSEFGRADPIEGHPDLKSLVVSRSAMGQDTVVCRGRVFISVQWLCATEVDPPLLEAVIEAENRVWESQLGLLGWFFIDEHKPAQTVEETSASSGEMFQRYLGSIRVARTGVAPDVALCA